MLDEKINNTNIEKNLEILKNNLTFENVKLFIKNLLDTITYDYVTVDDEFKQHIEKENNSYYLWLSNWQSLPFSSLEEVLSFLVNEAEYQESIRTYTGTGSYYL